MARRLPTMAAGAMVLIVALAAADGVFAIGYWNVPGNSCQWWGCGWGAGHHACYVLGPPSCEGCLAHGEVRQWYAPQPPCYACYAGDYCYDFRGAPAVLPGNHVPPMPEAAAPPALEQPAPDQEFLGAEPPVGEPMPEVEPEQKPLPEEKSSSRPIFGPPVVTTR